MAIEGKNFLNLEPLEVPYSKPIKIYVLDENKMERRIIKLDDLLTLINTEGFNGDLSQDHICYYRTAKERNWHWKRAKKMKKFGEGILVF